MEVQILHYYLKVFSIILIILLFTLSLYVYILLNKKFLVNKNLININQGDTISNLLDKNILQINKFGKIIFKLYYIIIQNNKIIHYGDFKLDKKTSFIELLNIISKPSNVLNKITIVEGWTKNDLNKELSKYFDDFTTIEYNNILADTYYFNKSIL